MTPEEKEELLKQGQTALSKMMSAASSNTEVSLTADELRGYFFFSQQAAKNIFDPPKREKDFDELAREVNGDDAPPQPPPFEVFDSMGNQMRRMKPQLKFIAHPTLQGVADKINEKFDAGKDFNLLWSVQHFSQVGFMQAILEFEPANDKAEPPPLAAS